ncbi:hypothetical protein [Flavobacterium sp. WC2509]|uniref:hypothetical protein n=1 Tax=Flavobacterium sp. WC2509 TaxID=3461406 RepID=UPI00404422AD
MKYRFVFRNILLIAVVITTFVCCGTDDYNTAVNDVSDTVQDGTWKVGYLFDSGEDKTQNYTGYNFTFDHSTEITVTKDTNSYVGVWSVSKSTSDNDLNSTVFMIAFGPPDSLIHLGRNWKVIQNTGTSLKLQDDSNGDSNINFLYFEKN